MGAAFQVFTKHGDIGADVRAMYEPDAGEVFVNLDSSQAEARVVFNLAGDEQALEDIDKHDYHALTASWFFGGTELITLRKYLDMSRPLDLQGKLYAMRAILERQNDEQPQNSTPKPVNTKSLSTFTKHRRNGH